MSGTVVCGATSEDLRSKNMAQVEVDSISAEDQVSKKKG